MKEKIRKILHIDMDAFYASIEQRDFPEYRGKPLVVGGSGRRGVVAAASYEARKYGIRSAMPTRTALGRFPGLIVARPRFDVYRKVSGEIMGIFRTWTDLVEPLSLDEAYLDVTENRKNQPSATLIAKEIKQTILERTGLTASAGVSVNKFLAKVASGMDKPDGLYVIGPEQAVSFIETLPVSRFHGVGRVTAEKMKSHGIETGGDLKGRSRQELVRLFGRNGSWFYDISRGIDNRRVSPDRLRKSFGKERTFETDIENLDGLHGVIRDIAGMLWEGAGKHGIRGRTLTLKVKYSDFRQITRSRTFPESIDSIERIEGTARQLMDSVFTSGDRIRLVGITISGFGHDGEPEQDPGNQLSFDF